MNPNEKIKARRQELGFKDSEIADQISVSWNEYFDIELHEHEIFQVAELRRVKRLCQVLNFEFSELFEMRCPFCGEGKQYLKDYSLPRNELIHKKRTEMGLSASEFGDRIGFEEAAINDMEKDPNYLERWPIDFVKDLSRVIDVPVQILLNIKCGKCGR
jgi:DNA-binding XRE family transcriptional regulator